MTDENFHKLALNESFKRVAKVAEERAAFNEAMDNLIAQDADLIDINNKDGAVLLRCPFCDGEAKITTCDLLDGDQWACVCCKVCNAQIVNEDEEDAITAWNTRQLTQSDNNSHKLALNESFERVAKVAKEREAFNKQMAIRAALEARGLEIREKNDD